MSAKVIFCFVFTLITCAPVYTQTPSAKSCDDCVGIMTCDAAVALLNKKDAAVVTQLRGAFCGYEGELPKVCCSDFTITATPPTNQVTTAISIDSHPNLRLLPNKCGEIDGQKIIGGRVAGLYEYPWMALISYRTRNGLDFECGGSLINERYVLTAAHCIVGLTLAGVRVGEHDIASDRDCQGAPPTLTCEDRIQDMAIEELIPHPEYQGKAGYWTNDIGLLRLRRPVNLSYKNAAVVCLPVTEELQSRNLSGLYGTVAGWGITGLAQRSSSKLLAVDVLIHAEESCRELYNRGNTPGVDATINKFCAGEIGKDSCKGDSGGPMVLKGIYRNVSSYIQHGVVSFGPVRCGSNFPSVYTNVAKYMTWILDNIRP